MPKLSRIEFDSFSAQSRPKLMKVARRFKSAVGAGYDIEDVVQEALTNLWLLNESDYQVRNVEALAVSLVKCQCVAYFRKYEKERRQTLAECDAEGGVPATHTLELKESIMLKKTLYSSLNETQRKYMDMICDGLSLDEISSLTGKPKTSIKTTISDSRRKLKTILNRKNRTDK